MSEDTDATQGGTEDVNASEAVENTTEATTEQPTGADEADIADDTGEEAPKPKQVPWFQKRIDEVTAKRYDAERDAAYWRGLAEGGGHKPQPQAQDGPPRDDQFATWEEFEEAKIDYAVNQRFQARQEQESRQAVARTYGERVAKFSESKPDYAQLVNDPSLRITPVMADVIAESDVGPQVAYHLGSNPGEAARIAGLPLHRQASELGKLEARLSTQAPKPTLRDPPPPPPKTVSGLSAGLTKAPEDMGQDEYNKWREAGGGG